MNSSVFAECGARFNGAVRRRMSTTPPTDAALEALSKRAVSAGYSSYPHIMPILIDEILRLRQVVRRLALEAATRDDGSAS